MYKEVEAHISSESSGGGGVTAEEGGVGDWERQCTLNGRGRWKRAHGGEMRFSTRKNGVTNSGERMHIQQRIKAISLTLLFVKCLPH